MCGFDLPVQRPYKLWGFHNTQEQLEIIALAALIAFLSHALVQYTRIGKAVRGSAGNAMLAQVRGISTARGIMFTGPSPGRSSG